MKETREGPWRYIMLFSLFSDVSAIVFIPSPDYFPDTFEQGLFSPTRFKVSARTRFNCAGGVRPNRNSTFEKPVEHVTIESCTEAVSMEDRTAEKHWWNSVETKADLNTPLPRRHFPSLPSQTHVLNRS